MNWYGELTDGGFHFKKKVKTFMKRKSGCWNHGMSPFTRNNKREASFSSRNFYKRIPPSFEFCHSFQNHRRMLFLFLWAYRFALHAHGTMGVESTSTFWRLYMGWLFWILETYQIRFEFHWIQKSSLKFTP